jgi:AcrR family transcriptional regulator
MSTPVRPPGRPAGFDRTEALDSLVELFWRRGYEATTQDVMRDTTGLSSSSLYRTFGTKAETFEAVLRRYLELSEGMIGPLEEGSGGVADLHALLDRLAGQVGSASAPPGCLMVASAQDPINADPRVAELTGRHLARMRSGMRAVTARAAAAGEHLPGGPEEFADTLYAAVLGILGTARSGDRRTALALVDAVRALLPARD